MGYFPPVANPPAKEPLLKLLKQGGPTAWASFGHAESGGPGLQGAGQRRDWFIGRLQTERDKARVLEALQGTESQLAREELEKVLSSLGNRIFLLHNVHDAGRSFSKVAGP